MSAVARLLLAPLGSGVFLLRVGEYKVGRTSACDVYLNHPTVSRLHASLVVGEQLTTVHDHRSLNGTFVGGFNVERQPLDHGVELVFGSVPCVYERLDSQAGDASTASGEPVYEGITPAERRVFDLLLLGHAEKKIAAELKLSKNTVHNHVKRIYRAFDVHARSELLSVVLNSRHARRKPPPD